MRSNRFDIKIDDINMQHTSGNEGRKKGWKKQKKGAEKRKTATFIKHLVYISSIDNVNF